jgi:uncharacterized protein
MLYSAFILGLISSIHCVGMCGPIALILPYQKDNRWQRVKETVTYNIGRVMTYTLLGLLFGYLGKGLALVGLQQSLSVLFGILFILIASLSIFYAKNKHLYLLPIQKVETTIRTYFNRFLKQKNTFFVLGMLNGLLPCGIVWWAIAASILTFNPAYSAFYMFLFGIGTMPLMLVTVLASSYIKKPFVRKFYTFIPVYQLLLGFFLLWRAYQIDPSVFWAFSDAPMCH